MTVNMDLLTEKQRNKMEEWFSLDTRLHEEHPMFINAYHVLVEANSRKDSDFDPDKIFFVVEEEEFIFSYYSLITDDLKFKTLNQVGLEINNKDNILDFYTIIDDEYNSVEYEISKENIVKVIDDFINAYKIIINKQY